MRLKDIYRTIILKGMEADPRGKDGVERFLNSRKRVYDSLQGREKEFYDMERLTNPYDDTRILHGSGDEEIKTLLVGIDLEVQEVLLADRLSLKDRRIDLLMSHHPEGRAYASFYEVMHMQADILNKFGVPINIAEDLLEKRIKEVERKVSPANHTRAVDAARLLNIPFMCAHTPADNMVTRYLQGLFDMKSPDTLQDIINLLIEIPEYREAAKNNAGPTILIGNKERRAGRVFVDMTGGTEGAKNIFESLANSGVGTIVGMHLSEEHRKEAEKHHINVVIAGHIASDNLGVNLLLDELEDMDTFEIIPCSGFRRFKRNRGMH